MQSGNFIFEHAEDSFSHAILVGKMPAVESSMFRDKATGDMCIVDDICCSVNKDDLLFQIACRGG